MNAASFGVRKERELALITRVKLAPEFKKPMSLRSFKGWTQCHTVTKSCPENVGKIDNFSNVERHGSFSKGVNFINVFCARFLYAFLAPSQT